MTSEDRSSEDTSGISSIARVFNAINPVGRPDYKKPPIWLERRSSTLFIVLTVGLGIFTDLFLYGLIVPVVPFMLEQRIGVPSSQIQSDVSMLLAVYAGASVAISPLAGILGDRTSSRQLPFLIGLGALFAATLLFALGSTLWVLILGRILQGISGSVVWTIGLAMCVETVGPERLGTVIGTIFSVISVGTQSSPTIGGVLYKRAGFTGVFAVGMVLLAIDFVMRLLVIEKKVAARYGLSERGAASQIRNGEEGDQEPGEESPLLNRAEESENDKYLLNPPDSRFVKTVPIIVCLKDSALLSALWLSFAQAFLFGSLDATITVVARDYYGFDSQKAGLLFLASGIPELVFGPLGGMWVDKYGTKWPAVFSCLWLVPALTLLRLVEPGGKQQIIVWAVLLVAIGIGMGILGSPGLVEAGRVTDRYYKANKDFFGQNGPFAQLYGMNSMFFCSGLTLGPLFAGGLKDSIGYGNMNAMLAGLAGLTALTSWLFIGGRPHVFWRGTAQPTYSAPRA